MFIDGFSLSGYRSFGNDLQKIGPLGKVNLLVGQNNSGKSNVLLFLTRDFQNLVEATRERGKTITREGLDEHKGEAITEQRFGLGLKLDGQNYQSTFRRCEDKWDELPDNYHQGDRDQATDFINKILHSEILTGDTNTAWFTYVAPQASNDFYRISDEIVEALYRENINIENKISQTFRTLTYRRSQSPTSMEYKEQLRIILEFIAPHHLGVPVIHLIPAIRQIGEAGSDYSDYSGLGIIRRLHELQSPDHDQQHLKADFQRINDFLKIITGNATATLEIPRSEKTIIVHMDDKHLPLSSLGTGIHEMVILAAAATVLENQILCIEEPELHLHPLLQRKLLRYLLNSTNNQYFLTTHSAHLLDTPGVEILHVQHQDGKSNVTSINTPGGRSAICADLGYRASDLVQANAIIWVEGPSDRIYIKHWIKDVDSNLIEGVHYSVMFYGGRLLCHLSANDSEVEDFISLRCLNRHISILIDSDRKNDDQEINDTKKRVMQEFNSGSGFAWITKGREIENYIQPALLLECVQSVHKGVSQLEKTGQFDHCLPFLDVGGELNKGVDKIKVAHEVVKKPADLDILDLRDMVTQLVLFIKQANDLDEVPSLV